MNSPPLAIPADELHKHKRDIQRQAIYLWKNKASVFAGERPYQRWRMCVQIVAESWMQLGPQKDDCDPKTVICL